MEKFSFDVVVIGSGAAGLRAAISAREEGLAVCVIGKGSPGKGTSTLLSGGVFAGTRKGDPTDDHLTRTFQAGRGINQQDLLHVFVEEAPKRLRELLEWGMNAELLEGYLYSKGRAPLWGEEIIRSLVARNKNLGTRFINGLLVTGLAPLDGLFSVLAHSAQSGRWLSFTAKSVVLATGGVGALYLRHDNPGRMLGEGLTLALKAGAVLQNMEFMQFYPFSLAEPGLPSHLITPRLADKGRLINSRGEKILSKYAIEERPAGERARDRLSQALFKEIYREGSEVWLDLTDVTEKEWCSDPFSASTRETLGVRFGGTERPLRIAPIAHHFVGGVRIDPDGRTSVPGLFAAGEVTGGLHGANRLGGNALTETVVFGARAGQSAATWAKGLPFKKGKASPEPSEKSSAGPRPLEVRSNTTQIRTRLREIMWKEGGILRNRGGLTNALDALKEMQSAAKGLLLRGTPRSNQRILELRLGLQTAALIVEGALRREESRGAHFREDFPQQDDDGWRGHLQVWLDSEGKRVWAFQPTGPRAYDEC